MPPHRPRRTLAPRHVFLGRLYRSFGWSSLVIAVSLFIGMAGYHWLAGFGWVDAFLRRFGVGWPGDSLFERLG